MPYAVTTSIQTQRFANSADVMEFGATVQSSTSAISFSHLRLQDQRHCTVHCGLKNRTTVLIHDQSWSADSDSSRLIYM